MGGGMGSSGGGGGNLQEALGRMFGGYPQMSHYVGGNPSTTATGGATPTPIGGVDVPPADMGDPFGGSGMRGGIEQMGDPHMASFFNQFFGGGFGTNPSSGSPISGGTIDPTFWSNNNTGNPNTFAPLGIPAGGWVDPAAGALPHNLYHAGQHLSNT